MYYGIPKLVIWSNAQFTLTINPDIFSPLVIAFIVFSLHAVAYLSESIKGDYFQSIPIKLKLLKL